MARGQACASSNNKVVSNKGNLDYRSFAQKYRLSDASRQLAIKFCMMHAGRKSMLRMSNMEITVNLKYAIAAVMLTLSSQTIAADSTGKSAVGGGLGAAAGTALGGVLGGQTGEIIGGAVGGGVGGAVTTKGKGQTGAVVGGAVGGAGGAIVGRSVSGSGTGAIVGAGLGGAGGAAAGKAIGETAYDNKHSGYDRDGKRYYKRHKHHHDERDHEWHDRGRRGHDDD